MQHPGWTLIVVGALIAAIGVVWLLAPAVPWLGKLPGDIAIERENFRFYFPLTTCVLLSLLLTGVAGAMGFVMARWLVPLFTSAIAFAPEIEAAPDLRVFAFARVVSALTGLAAGLAPARFGARGRRPAGVCSSRLGSSTRPCPSSSGLWWV